MKKHCANVTNRGQIPVQIFLAHVFGVLQTHDVIGFVVKPEHFPTIVPRIARYEQVFALLSKPSPGLVQCD